MNINSIIEEWVDQKKSRYALTRKPNKIVEYEFKENSGSEYTYLNPWFADIPVSDNDTYIEITASNKYRIDTLANEYYGDSKYWWIIANVNNLSDPFEIPVGTVLRIPPQSSILVGGVIK